MKILKTGFDDLFVLELLPFKDKRGELLKIIHDATFKMAGLEHIFTESFYSISKKNVIRGMHFQIPPLDCNKLIHVIHGKILDVVLDIRKESTTYGKIFSIEIAQEDRKAIYIGKGFAHGFLSVIEGSIVQYNTTTSHSLEHERGILWNSFGFEWPVSEPIISERDSNFVSRENFNTPF